MILPVHLLNLRYIKSLLISWNHAMIWPACCRGTWPLYMLYIALCAWIWYVCAVGEACLIKAVIASPTSSHIGSEHCAHSNRRCMVLSTSPKSPHSALACSSGLVMLRCIFWLVQICLFMTRKLFVSVFEGILSLNKLLYPCINLWRAGTGIPSPLLVK